MPGQNAKWSEDTTSAASEFESILSRLHALGGSPEPDAPEDSRQLRSVPDLADVDPAVTVEDELVPPPLEPTTEPTVEPPLIDTSLAQTLTEILPVDIAPPTELVAPAVDVAPPAELVAPAVDVAPPAEFVEDPELVFELDGPLVFEEPPVDVAMEPPTAHAAEDLSLTEPPPVPVDDDIESLESPGEWVSYHNVAAEAVTTSEIPVISVDPATDPFVFEEEPVEPFPATDELGQPDFAAAGEATMPTFDAPEWSSEPDVEATDLFDQLSLDEQALEPMADPHSLDIDETLDFSDLEDAQGLAELAGDLELIGDVESGLSPILEGSDAYGALYATDEDLPLPDFTGVWVETGAGTVWDKDAAASEATGIPQPIERSGRGSGISVGRNELDSLRPVDEEQVVEEQPEGVARKLQLVMVVLFGLIALAIMFLDDPGAIDELRSIYDQFFG